MYRHPTQVFRNNTNYHSTVENSKCDKSSASNSGNKKDGPSVAPAKPDQLKLPPQKQLFKKMWRHLPFSFFLRSSSNFFVFFLSSSSDFVWGRLSTWVKIRLHSENQLPKLSGSALKVVVWVGGGWSNWLLCHSQLELRLSWGCDNYKNLL